LARNLLEETPKEIVMSKTTIEHDEIRRWVSERFHPARVKGTDQQGGLLRIDYPGYSGEESLKPITWTEFFKAFEKNQLAFRYEEETKSGEQSRFSKLISRRQDN